MRTDDLERRQYEDEEMLWDDSASVSEDSSGSIHPANASVSPLLRGLVSHNFEH